MEKVFIGWPDGGHNDSRFTKSLLDLQRFELTQPDTSYELIDIDHQTSIYIQENRNTLVQVAQQLKADWLLQLDGDESFDKTLLRQLMRTALADKTNRLVVVGLYSNVANFGDGGMRGSFDVVDCIYAEHENGAYVNVRPPDDLRPFCIDAAGTGVFLTHMSIYDKIEEPWYETAFIKPAGVDKFQFMNEDLAFCRRIREAGFPIWCDPLAEVTHWKTLPLTPSSLRQFMARARKAELEMSGRTS